MESVLNLSNYSVQLLFRFRLPISTNATSRSWPRQDCVPLSTVRMFALTYTVLSNRSTNDRFMHKNVQ